MITEEAVDSLKRKLDDLDDANCDQNEENVAKKSKTQEEPTSSGSASSELDDEEPTI